MSYFIYKLIDPRDGAAFYIGATNDHVRRLMEHKSCVGKNPQKDERIRGLQRMGVQPDLIVLEIVEDINTLKAREEYWIQHYIEQGASLTNLSLHSIGVNTGGFNKKRKLPSVTDDNPLTKGGIRVVKSIFDHEPKMYTEQETAEILGISIEEIYQLAERNEIYPHPAHYQIVTGNTVYTCTDKPLFHQKDVDKLQQCIKTKALQ